MDKIRKERGVERRHFTKILHNLESMLDPESHQISEDDTELKASLNKLNASISRLKALNGKIRELIMSKDDFEKELEEELEDVDKYETRYEIVKLRIGNSSNKTGRKLPTLELKKFDGNIKNWLQFWGSFNKIDSDPKLDEVDKLQYLAQSMELGTDVKNFVDSFPLTKHSYMHCVKELRSRYAREDLLIQVYVRELLSLILNKDSNSDLVHLYDKLNGQLRALEILGVTKDKFSAFLLPMVESALPSETLQAWERLRPEKCDDLLSELLKFLKKEVESTQRIQMANTTFLDNKKHPEPTAACFTVNAKGKQDSTKCIWCDKNHTSLECYKLGKMSIEERREHIKKKHACALCLKIGHHAKICKAFIKCYVCGLRHSPVMCTGVNPSAEARGRTKQESNKAETLQNFSQNNLKTKETTTLLQTVAVKIKNGEKSMTVRALLDSGSQRSYIKTDVVKKLGLPAVGQEELSHSLFGGVTVSFKQYNLYDFTVRSLDNLFTYKMSALEQSCVCKNVPKVDVSNESVMRLLNKHNIKLTDSESTEVGLLIGADYSGLLLTDLFVNLDNGLTAIKTKLGWTLQGKVTAVNCNIITSLFCSHSISNFWDLEMLGINDPTQVQSKQQREEEVMSNFEENIQVNAEGRYQVYLPWKTGHDGLQSNQQLAIRRLDSTTRKLNSCGKFHEYNKILNEWEHAGIIEEVPEAERDCDKSHYLPHRAVTKEASLTTKLRPVFDASAKDTNGRSLNSCLDKGINFLDRIPKIMNGFRKERIGVTADIAKAFLQIAVTPQDRDYLRFVWWKDESCDEIKTFRHCRVVFGLTSSPFLLSATISHHLNQVTAEQKKTADILTKSFYVDNLVTSLDTAEQTQDFIRDAKNIMNEAQFDLRQWVTSPLPINETNNSVISVLGLQWHTASDQLSCNLQAMTPYTELGKITKRNLLSLTQKIFDPIGFTCPVTLVPRLILQQTWNKNITWDEDLPNDILIQFKNWYEHLDCLNDCRLPRRLSAETLQECSKSLHMFCDASKDGYAACVFLRAENRGTVTVRLVSAKSRVSLPEKITIPRSELLAALIGSRLLKEARESLKLKDCDEYCWTDSGVALFWIKRELPWNTYIGNRVREIRENTNTNDWNHVPGTENWADLASRGCNARQLVEVRWWEGPTWLLQRRELWPRSALVVDEKAANKELKKTVCITNTCCEEGILNSLSQYFSKYTKLIRMTAWILRFTYNASHKNDKKKGELTLEECDEAERKIIILIQQENKQVIEKQCGKSTQIYYDVTDKLMKVKTKLLLTDFPESTKSPVIVPAKNVIIRRMVEQRHIQLLHAGTNMMITELRKRYWIIGVRLLVKSIINKCIICMRHRSQAARAPTAPLPLERVQLTAAFEVSGVDLAGPLFLNNGEKCWIVIYTCAVYRAVHFELTQSLSTEAFMRTLRRFKARRGRVHTMISDHGTNFSGTKNLLKELDWNEVQKQSTILRIKWKMNSPTAAWWGGFFERLIQVLKGLLRKVLGTAAVSYEELETLICDCEAVMNDRPLTYVEDDSCNSLEPLTPSCFLQVQTTDVTDLDQIDRTSINHRVRYLQKLRDDFRQRFKNEYLTSLVQRGTNQYDTVKVGDVVLIENTERRIKWPLGLVIKTFVGKDGIIRTAQVKTSTGFKTRPIQRLYRLELSSSEVEEQRDSCTNDPIGKKYNIIVINPSSTTQQPMNQIATGSGDEIAEKKTTRSGRVIKMPTKYTI